MKKILDYINTNTPGFMLAVLFLGMGIYRLTQRDPENGGLLILASIFIFREIGIRKAMKQINEDLYKEIQFLRGRLK